MKAIGQLLTCCTCAAAQLKVAIALQQLMPRRLRMPVPCCELRDGALDTSMRDLKALQSSWMQREKLGLCGGCEGEQRM